MKKNQKVDDYILKSASFSQPILYKMRAIIEEAEPHIEETIKWGFPCFTYQNKIICSFSAYKNHCVFRFWQGSSLEDSDGILAKVGETEMGELSKIKNLEDLPNSEVLIKYIRTAIELSQKGSAKKPMTKEKKLTIDLKSIDLPEIFNSFPKQAEKFDTFSPSHRKEYISWINEAKTDETKLKRIKTMMEWLLEGKSRNWKYEKNK
jgi:uncharacterized protein YdeI (YjbR/CyaY-like superfamily)